MGVADQISFFRLLLLDPSCMEVSFTSLIWILIVGGDSSRRFARLPALGLRLETFLMAHSLAGG